MTPPPPRRTAALTIVSLLTSIPGMPDSAPPHTTSATRTLPLPTFSSDVDDWVLQNRVDFELD